MRLPRLYRGRLGCFTIPMTWAVAMLIVSLIAADSAEDFLLLYILLAFGGVAVIGLGFLLFGVGRVSHQAGRSTREWADRRRDERDRGG